MLLPLIPFKGCYTWHSDVNSGSGSESHANLPLIFITGEVRYDVVELPHHPPKAASTRFGRLPSVAGDSRLSGLLFVAPSDNYRAVWMNQMRTRFGRETWDLAVDLFQVCCTAILQ
jgi:hypothetical protein